MEGKILGSGKLKEGHQKLNGFEFEMESKGMEIQKIKWHGKG
jgi:hypothetical protein